MHAAHAHPSSMMQTMQNMVAMDDNMVSFFRKEFNFKIKDAQLSYHAS